MVNVDNVYKTGFNINPDSFVVNLNDFGSDGKYNYIIYSYQGSIEFPHPRELNFYYIALFTCPMSHNTVTTPIIDDDPTNNPDDENQVDPNPDDENPVDSNPDDNESTTENPDTEPTDTNSEESIERRLLYDLETGLFVLFNIL